MSVISGLYIIAALGKDRGIGKDNQLLWKIPSDIAYFKALTLGGIVIMGRKTYESIGKCLEGRTNIVISRNSDFVAPGVFVEASFERAIQVANAVGKAAIMSGVWVIGGAEIYAQALEQAERLYLTLIDDGKPADTFFPPYEHLFTKKVNEEKRILSILKYRWVRLERE